jgi:hypothetical protein
MHSCPVCGYDRMLRPPAAGYICPCCGMEFELDDDELSHDELRRRWIARGKRWFSNATPPPAGWNATLQLVRAGFGANVYELVGGYTQTKNVTTIGSQVVVMVAAA